MSLSGIIILCHGSRGDRATSELPQKMQKIVAGVSRYFTNEPIEVNWAALQFNHPDLEEAAESLVNQGVKSVIIMPYFIFSGRHIDEDIPEIMDKLAERYDGVKFTLTRTLGDGELFVPQVINRLKEALEETRKLSAPAPVAPEAIEQQSMEIIERCLPPDLELSFEEKEVAKRIIHACGDPQIIESIHFSPQAVIKGLEAVKKNSPIYTDVRMVAIGINTRLAEQCGCKILCAMDEAPTVNSTSGNTTRSAAAINALGHKLDNAVIAIGNAPTALLALVDLIKNDYVNPALVVGIPVGFVQAAESKEALMKLKVPFITVVGTRGGSAMAVATVNALLKLAVKKAT